MRNLFSIIIISAFICAQNAKAADVNPDEIVKKTLETYQKMKSFKAKGEVVSEMDMGSRKIEIKTTFTLLMEKPNLYKISWSQNAGLRKQEGTVWNAGEGAYLYSGTTSSYSKLKTNETALAAATGISAGAANTMPSLLLLQHSVLKMLTKCKYIKEEKINTEMCYVIDAETDTAMMTLWISKSRSLFLQIKKNMGKKPVAQKFEMSDKQLADALKSMGKEATKENIKNMKNMMKMAAEMTKTMKATFIETYKNIEIDKTYKKEDFIFTPPKNATLKKDMFGDIFSEKPKAKTDLTKQSLKKQTLKEMEDALNATTEDKKKFYMLSKLAKKSFEDNNMEKAAKYANELLKKADNYKKNWNYGNAIHHGNLILGRIALKSEKVKEAETFLLKAGKTPGSPQLDSFGPNMTLAKDLLKKGEKKVVLEYFTLCGKFWKMDRGQLKKWSSSVRKGETPYFGANLLY